MLPRPSGGWGRFGGAGAGEESDEDGSEAAGSFAPPSPAAARGKIKLGPALHDEEEDEEVLKELERVRRAAYEACLTEVTRHLDRFLGQRPLASFEDWISDLHPDNLQVDPVTGEVAIDQRFYAKAGEHRGLWNSRVPIVRQVQARSPDCSPASSMAGSSGARTPVLCRSAFSMPPLGHPYYELLGPPAPCRVPCALGGSHLLPPLRLSGDPGVDQLKVGALPVHLSAPSQFQWRAPQPVPVAAPAWYEWPLPGQGAATLPAQVALQARVRRGSQHQQQQQQHPQPQQPQQQQQQQQQQCYAQPWIQAPQPAPQAAPQPVRWRPLAGRAWSPPPGKGAGAARATSVSPLRTTGLPGRADSPLRTTGLPGRVDSPVRTVGLPSRGGSAVIRPPPPRRACAGGSFVWPPPRQLCQRGGAAAAGGA